MTRKPAQGREKGRVTGKSETWVQIRAEGAKARAHRGLLPEAGARGWAPHAATRHGRRRPARTPPIPGLLRAGLASGSCTVACAFLPPGESREGTPQGAGPHCPLAGVHVAVLVLVMVAESLLWASHSVPVLSSQTRTKLSGNADNAALCALALPGARGLGANEHARPLHATLADPDPR